ncbi:MAG: VCBS repeat-containing protein [Ignavibacteria bacterium]|nr:VCBS repeat-containing protein [Ignavibacteria bacterium]
MTFGFPSYRVLRMNAGYSRGGFLSRVFTALSLMLCLCSLPSMLSAQPNVSTRSPIRHLNTAPLGTNIDVSFTQNVTGATGSANVLKVYGMMTGRLSGAYSNPGANQIQLNPTNNLKPGEQIFVTVTNAQNAVFIDGRPEVYSFRAAASVGSGTFVPGSTPVVGNSPRSITIGDFDGDGDLDIATANLVSNNISVRLNMGSGTYAAAVNYPTGNGPLGIIAGDLDGDGDLDLATANAVGDNVSVRLNTGSGVFAAAVNYPAGNGTNGITIGDFDGDGDLDIATGNNLDGNVSVFLNTGSGTYAAAVNYPAGSDTRQVIAGDFDGDGDLDLATANFLSDNVSVFLNTGSGVFAAAVNYPAGNGPRGITAGDFDGDGDLDLATGNGSGNNVSIFLNMGSGIFAAPVNYPAGNSPHGISAGDFDGDGDLDLATANEGSDNVSILRNIGTGIYAAAVNYPAGNSPFGIIVGDVDGDGDLDLATANDGSDNVSILFNVASMNVQNNVPPFGIPPTTPTFNTMTAALNSNIVIPFNQTLNAPTVNSTNFRVHGGFTGLKAATYSAAGATATVNPTVDFRSGEQVWVSVTNAQSTGGASTRPFVMGFRTAAGAGPATFQPGSVPVVGTSPYSVISGDFDGDGDLDLATANYGSNNTSILLNTGAGAFAAAVNYAVGTGPISVTSGDFDGDGDLDLAVANESSNNTSILLNIGAGTFAAAVNYAVGTTPYSVSSGDFDGDGDLDLAVANSNSNNTSILLNTGAGVFAAAVNYAVGTNPVSVTSGDFDGDGDLDLAVANFNSGNASILLNTGAGTFEAAVNYALGTQPRSVTSGDFDGDGDLDLAVTNQGSNNTSILLNTGAGVFAAAVNYAVGTGPISVTSGDFDGDGDLDLATANNGGNNTSILRNTGAGAFAAAVNYAVGTDPREVTGGDFDGDGDLDLATANFGSNNVSILFNSPPMNVLGNIPPFTPRPTTTPLLNTMNYGTPTGSPMKVPMNTVPTGISVTFSQNATSATLTDPTARNVMKVFGTTSRGYRSGQGFSGAGATMTFTTTANFNVGEQVWVTVTNAQSTGGAFTRPFVMGFRTRAGTGPAVFQPSSAPAAGTNPESITSADFDGDGDLDVAIANFGSANTSILLNTGAGAFAGAVNYGVGSQPYSVISGDFDNDGDLDVATANNGIDNVSVLLNTGAGAFAAAVNYGVGSQPRAITSGDFDGDGDLDLAVANLNGNTISILLNNGNGTFAPAANYAGGSQPRAITSGDFDGDGDLDLAVPNFLGNNVDIFLNTGSGTFVLTASYAVGTAPAAITGGDFDGDGDLDLAVANGNSNNTSILLNTGSGIFAAAVNYAVGVGPRGITSGDVDGDGDLDLSVANFTSNDVSVLLNAGAGSFGTAVQYAVGTGPRSLTSADFDGDGDLDLVASNFTSNNASILLNALPMTVLGNIPPYNPRPTTVPLMNTMNYGTPTGSPVTVPMSTVPTGISVTFSQNATAATFTDPTARNVMKVHGTTSQGYRSGQGFSGAGATMTFTTTANFNPGEQVWVSVTNAQSTGGAFTRPFVMGVRTRAGAGPGTFYPAANIALPSGVAGTNIADMNGDGNPDIVALLRWSNQVAIILNTGPNTFAAPVTYGIGGGATGPESMTVGDFDNDGDLDVATANFGGAGNLSVLLNNGNGTFAGATVYATSGPTTVVTGDVNADGYLDLIAVNTFIHSLSVFRNNGNGTFTAAGAMATGAGSFPRRALVGDMDNDGDVDVMTQLAATGQVAVFRNDGTGIFGAQANYTASATEADIASGDLNGDGYIDLVSTPITVGSNAEVRFNNGDGTFAAPTSYPTGTSGIPVRFADVNGDGSLDLVTTDGTSASDIVVRLNNGTGSFGSATRNPSIGGISMSDLADIDGDGDLDMLSFRYSENGITIVKNGVQPLLNTFAPARNINTAAVSAAISPTFSQTMTTATASAPVMKVHGGFSGLKAGTYSGGGTATPSLAPTTAFRPGEQVWVTVTNAQTSLAGSVGIAARPQVYGFRAQAGPGPGTFYQFLQGTVFNGYSSADILTADLNNDGRLDIVAYINATQMRVYLGNGDGTFAVGALVSGVYGSSTARSILADVDNDGFIDILNTDFNTGNQIRIFKNDGTGAFPSQMVGSPLATSNTGVRGLTLGDVNGDGFLDLGVTYFTSSNTLIGRFLNLGNGSFAGTEQTYAQAAAVSGRDWSQFADMDNDGDLDWVITDDTQNTISIRLNDGTGNFSQTATGSPYTCANVPIYLSIADINNDGRLDVAVGGRGADIGIFLNTGTASILPASATMMGASAIGYTYPTFADVNGDGQMDIIASILSSSSFRVGLGNNSGTFPTLSSPLTYGTFAGNSYPTPPADYDGDGDLDIAFNADNQIYIWKNGVQPVLTTFAPARNINTATVNATISPTFNQTMTTATASAPAFKVWGGFSGLKAGAYSGGGTATPSLAPTTQFRPGEQVWVTVTNAQTNLVGSVGIAARPQVYGFRTQAGAGPARLINSATSGVGNNFAWLLAGDVTGDGNPDIIGTSGMLYVYAGDGAGNFAAPTTHGASTGNRRLACTGDFNNDGRLDVVSAILFGGVDVFLNTGSALPAAANSTIAVGGSAFALCVADFNADGNMDFAVTDYFAGTVRIAFGNGTGAFPVVSGPLALGTVNASALKAGDVDNDGDIDIIAGNFSATNNFHVLRNDGMGNFTVTQTLTVGNALGDLADIDGNGGLDAAVSDAATGNVIILRNPGTGTFTADPAITGLSANAIDAVFADMDGLNGLDLVVDGKIYLNNGAGSFALFSSDGQTATYSQAVADFDNDGDMDIVITTGGGTQPWFLWKNATPMNVAGNLPPFTPRPATTPLLNTVSAALATNITIPFSSNLNAPTVNAANFRVHGGFTGLKVAAYSAAGATATVNPTVDFKSGEQVWVTVTNAQSTGGVSTRPFVMGFQMRAGTGPGTIYSTSSPQTGLGPYCVTSGDFDGDGDLDLATANRNGNSVSVLLNGGIGSFAAAVNYGAGAQPLGITSGDFDNDGDLDLAVANYSGNNVSILLNIGGGTFAAAVDYGAGSGANSVSAGDFDGDGDLDLAVANYNGSNVSVLMNNGNGTFAGAVNYGTGSIPRATTIGDFDGDGDLDMAVSNGGSSNMSMLLNTGNGVFAAAVNYATGTNPVICTSGDFDGDGDLDFALSNFNSNDISVLRNNGNATFAAAVNYPVGANASGITTGDFDGDGDLDIAATSDNKLNVLMNIGGGVFAAAVNSDVGLFPTSVVHGDFDGDGDLDLATANEFSHNVSIMKNGIQPVLTTLAPARNINTAALAASISPTFTQTMTTGTASVNAFKVWGGFTGLKAGAYSGGGTATPSIAPTTAFRPGEQVWVTVTNAQTSSVGSVGIAARPHVYGFRTAAVAGPAQFVPGAGIPSGLVVRRAVAGDVNNDGLMDIVAASDGSSQIAVMRNLGGGTSFSAPALSTVGMNGGGPVLGDFNNDGWIDIATANYGANNVSVLLNSGTGTFPGVGTTYGTGGVQPNMLVTADVNGDGNLDLITANTATTTLAVFLGTGTGTFPATATTYGTANASPFSLAAGDFDNDGDIDIALGNFAGTVEIMQNTGSGSFVSLAGYATGFTNVLNLHAVDINNDGNLDLVAGTNGGSNVSVLQGLGTGLFAAPQTNTLTANANGLSVGDFDGNGQVDVVAGAGTGNMAFLRGNGTMTLTAAVNTTIAGNNLNDGLAVADFDGDGDMDVLASLSSGNAVQILFNTIVPTTYYYQSGNANNPANWNSLPWGGGLAATSFSSPATDFYVMGGGATTTASVIAPITIGANVSLHVTTPSVLAVGNFVTITNNGFLNVSGSTLQAARLQLVGSGAVTGNPVRYWSTNATLEYQTIAGTLTTNVELPSPMPGSVWVNGSNTVTLWGSTQVNGTFTMQSGTFAVGANTLTLNGAATFTGGSMTGGASSGLAITGAGNLNGAMTLTGGLQTLTMNRASATLTLGAPLDVTGTLTLTQGYVNNTPANVLSVTNPIVGAIAGGGTTAHIAGTLRRSLPAGGGIFNFPVGGGTGTTYLPLSMNYASAAGGATYEVESILGASGGTETGIMAGLTLSTAEYWRTNSSGVVNTATLTFQRTPPMGSLTGGAGGNVLGNSVTSNGAYTGFLSTVVPNISISNTAPQNLSAGTMFYGIGSSIGPPLVSALSPTRNNPSATPATSPIAITFSQVLTAFSSRTWGSMTGQNLTATSFAGNIGTQGGNTFKPGEKIHTTVMTGTSSAAGFMTAPHVYEFVGEAVNGIGTLYRTNGFSVGTTSLYSSAVADVDKDGNVDAIIIEQNAGSARIQVARGDGMGGVLAPIGYLMSGPSPQGRFVTTGDFNNDGWIDIVAANNGDSKVDVFINNGSGGFGAPVIVPTAFGLVSVVTADFNGDGNLDIAATSFNSHEINVYSGNGGGGFALLYNVTLPLTPSPNAACAGDFDNDGDMDFLVFANNGNRYTFRNNGAGSFVVTSVAGTGATPKVFDMDGDGDVDIVYEGGPTGVAILENDGTGNFPITHNIASGLAAPYGLAVGNFDNDPRPDIFCNDGTRYMVLRNTGGWAFTQSATGSPEGVFACSPGDFDNDGDLDIFALGSAGGVLLKNGSQPILTSVAPTRHTNTATLGASIAPVYNQTMTTGTASVGAFKVWGGFTGIKAGTYSGGGGTTPSLAPTVAFLPGEQVWVSVTQAQTSVVGSVGIAARPVVYSFRAAAGVGPGTFQQVQTVAGGGGNTRSVAAGDWDNNGVLDLVMVNQNGSNNIRLMMNNGAGSFTAQAPLAMTLPSVPVVRDFDNDGNADIIVSSLGTSSAVIFRNFPAGTMTNVGSIAGLGGLDNLAAADFNGDGLIDIVASCGLSGIRVARNNGGMSFTTYQTIPVGNTESCAVGDVDNDGDVDIVYGTNGGNTVGFLVNDGFGNFSTTPFVVGAVNTAIYLSVGDLDNDGDVDVVVGNINSGAALTILENTTSGGILSFGIINRLVPSADVHIADYNGDGSLDIVSVNNNTVYALLNAGAGTLAARFPASASSTTLISGTTSFCLASGDWDGDGDIDIATANHASNDVSILFNQNAPIRAGFGNALSFNGINQSVNAGAALAPTSPLTLEAWINPASFVGGGHIVGKNNVVGLSVNAAGNLVFQIGSGAAWLSTLTSTTTVPLGAWSHVAATYDGATMMLYVNGMAVGSLSTAVAVGANASVFSIGALSGAAPFFTGAIDEVRVWNTALGQNVVSTYNGVEISTTHPNWGSLVSYWRLNEYGGASAADSKGVNTGTLLNAPVNVISQAPVSMVADPAVGSVNAALLPATVAAGLPTYTLVAPASALGTVSAPVANAITFTNLTSPVALNATDTFGYQATDGVSVSTATMTVRYEPRLTTGGAQYAVALVNTPLTTPTVVGGTGPLTWQWSPATSLSATNVASPIFNGAAGQAYTVTVTDALGFSHSTAVTVSLVSGAYYFRSGDASVPSNWLTNYGLGVPAASLTTPGTTFIVMGNGVLSSTIATANATFTLGAGVTMRVQAPSVLTVDNGMTLVNNGTLIVEGTASTGGTLRFVGSGTITGTAPLYQSPMTILQYSGTNVVRTTTPLEFPSSMPATVVVDEGVTAVLDDHKTFLSGLVLGGLLDIRNRNILLQGRLDLRGAFIANNFSNVEIGHQSGTPAAIQGTFNIATNVLNDFTMNRPASVLTLGSPMLIRGGLSMARGFLRSDTSNHPIVVNTNFNAIVGGNDSSFVEGPIRRYFPTNILTSGSGSWLFPTGRAGKYLPFTLIDPRTGGNSPLLEAEAFSGAQGGTMDSTLSAIGQGEYWNVRLLAGDHTQSRAELGRFGAFVQPIPVGSVVAKSPTRNGIYTNIGGSVSGNQIQSSTFANFSTFTIGTPFSAVAPSQQPTITNFGPTIGTSSTRVVVNGTNLNNLTGVRIGGVPVSFTVLSSTRITLTLSSGTQTGPITLQTATSGSTTSFQPFTFIGPPTMATVSPEFFALGQDIVISGNNFYGTPTSGELYLPVVRIGGITASSVEVISPTQMRVRFTAAATGNLTVQSWGGIATTATVVGVLPPPTLLGFSPGTAAAGETITLRGTDFRLISSITIGGVPVTNYILTSSTGITLTVPAGAGGATGSGFIRIQTSGGSAVSGTALTIIAPPSITGFSPTVGSAGQIVEISGTNFLGTTAVRFGNTTATFTVSADGRSIRAIIPSGVSTGASISVSTRGGTVTATQSFGGTPQLNPTITGFEPVPAVEGAFLTVRGVNFPYNPNGQSAASVFFGGIAIPGAVYTSSTTLTFRIPSGVVPQTVFSTQAVLSVRTPQGITSASLQVPVFAPDAPVITGFTPEEGDSITTITIEGRNFGTSLRSSIVDITIGGVPVQSFVVQNSRLIVSVVGNVASGAVVIRTPLGTITTTATFRYTGAVVGGVARQDSVALVTLYSALGGTSWTRNTNWLRGFVGSWYGVTVEGGRVRELRLPSNNLRGTVSSAVVDSALARLDGLRALDLSGNGLNGTLPRSLSKLKLLETLNLGKNNLTGNLKDLCGLLKLRDLDISNNALRDSLSNVLCCLINLERAIVNNNRLYGPIPQCLLNLERLSVLDASANELSDSLPSGLGTLRLLTVLNLRKNRLTGALPAAWGNNEETIKAFKGAAQVTGLTGLQVLDLGVNAITDGIPDSWATLTGLRTLALDSNRLTGVVPEGFAGLVRLQTLLLSKNALTNMPDLRSIIRLNTVAVDNNAFEFGPLENNRWTPIFRYAPQAEVGPERTEEVALDGVARLSLQVSGERNWYEWRKRQPDGAWKPITAKSTTSTVVFASFQDADAGVYRCYVTNPLLPNLTLISREQTLLAVEPKSAPPVPILIAPERNETTALRPTLVWTTSEGAASYTAQIATQADFGRVVNSQNVQQTLEAIQTGIVEAPQLNALQPSTTYYWRVVARNRFGESVWSTSSTFVTTDRDVAFWARRTDFGRIPRGDTAFAILRVRNVASSAATLVSLESSDAGFRVESGGQPSGGTVFQAGEVRDYTVRFTPDAVRRFSADIRFDYSVNGQRDVWVHSERLRGIGSALKLVAPALDTILIGLPRVAAALLINRGNVPVDIAQTRFRSGGEGVFQIKGAPDSKLGVGDTATVLIRCEAKSIGALPTALLESSGIVQSTPTMFDTARVIVRSFARLRQPSDLVARVGVRPANNINNVPPGTTVPMELYLASGSAGRDMLLQRAEPFINGSIRYGNQVLTLAPQENVWRRARNSGVGNRMERALMPRTTIAPTNGLVLAQFNLQVVAGETDTTSIEIEDLRWEGVYLTEYANTNFRARVSQAGGKRLIAGASAGITAVSIAPNPSRDVLEVTYTLAKSGFVTVSLVDVRGQEVGTFLSQVQAKGTHTLPVRVERFASGSYTVRLSVDAEEVYTQQIQVVR